MVVSIFGLSTTTSWNLVAGAAGSKNKNGGPIEWIGRREEVMDELGSRAALETLPVKINELQCRDIHMEWVRRELDSIQVVT